MVNLFQDKSTCLEYKRKLEMDKYKSANRIKEYILFKFFKYHCKSDSDYNGTENITIFEKLSDTEKFRYYENSNLNKHEIPVIIYKISYDYWIIHSTENLIKFENNSQIKIPYSEIDYITGFDFKNKENQNLVEQNGKKMIIQKAEGYILKFGIRLKNKQIIHWMIPTGYFGYSLWNFTNDLDYIKKFKIQEYS